ncbi:S8 family serine peptidase [Jeotgalibacillus proteolyticus]|uniref:S8 family serine peptidase n=1 Tax=Jeotgalibacillus proteolyticus TaxID=2082395 RepID=UPI00143157F7|nr:S8 family serine peptidase [Jeotgalibacillus proteolyticus]
MKVLKRSLLLSLVFLLFFSSMAMGARQELPEKPDRDNFPLEITEDPDKDLRIIVELNDAPVIEKAIKKGISLKDLSKQEQKTTEDDLIVKQASVQQAVQKVSRDIEIINEFTTVVNGFSATVKAKDVSAIEKINGVKEVHIATEYERPVVKPEMKYSKELIEAQRAWNDYGYKGEGMVVGVIDTGIDPSHKDMTISEGTENKLSESAVNKKITDLQLKGEFYTEKVPYGYNYMDNTTEIKDIGAGASEHGMHVAGTVGANGNDEEGGLSGVAPEAQLLALKVFGNDPLMPSTFSDIIIKAIDDAIKMDADVLNLSLGATAGFVSADDPEQEAVKRAVDSGIMVSISAGNSALLGDGFDAPYASNPDYGVSGSPGVSYESLQVASLENTYIDMDALTYDIDGETGTASFLSASSVHPNDFVKTEYELVNSGLGTEADFAGKNLTGKYALVQRGGITFVEKAMNAEFAGAEGVIIYNNQDGVLNMASDPSITIPQLALSKADGERLASALSNGSTVKVNFNGETITVMNPQAGAMSDFTSWGLTPNLDFKPEITAPGGNILSTLNDNEYGVMSGTSMAAPHVAGGSALVFQRVDEEFGAETSDRVNLAKNLMMNTSTLVYDSEDFPVSPRRQGAGLMQLHAALSTPAVVTEKETNEAKVALKEISGDSFEFTLSAQNLSDEEVKYDVAANIQTDYSQQGYVYPNVWGGQEIQGAAILINGQAENTVSVPAGGSVDIKVEVDLSNAAVEGGSPEEIFENGYHVEGFVTFTDPTDTVVPLHVPYAGFKGDWTKAPVVDSPLYDDTSFYGITSLLSGDTLEFLGQNIFDIANLTVDPEKVAFSPNNDKHYDTVLPVISFLRNAKEFKVNVTDKDKNVLRTIRSEKNVRKNFFDNGSSLEYTLDPSFAWDGKVNNKIAKEGQYYIELLSKVDYPGAEWQAVHLPVKVDVTPPEIEASLDFENQTITYQAQDAGVGVQYLDVLVDGTSVITEFVSPQDDTFAFKKKVKENQKVEIVAYDYAGNKKSAVVQDGGDNLVPELYVLSPAPLEVTSEKTVFVEGFATSPLGVESIEIDGKKVELEEFDGEVYFFEEVTFEEDGVHDIQIKATGKNGKSVEIARKFLLDSTAPVLEVLTKVPGTVGANEPNPKIDVKVADNFDELRFHVNGSEVFANSFDEPFEMRSIEKVIEGIELPLQPGVNRIVLEVSDLADNVTQKTLTIYKNAEGDAGNHLTIGYTDEEIAQLISEADGEDIELEIPLNAEGKLSADVSLGEGALKDLATNEMNLWIGSGDKGVYIPAEVIKQDLQGNVVLTLKESNSLGNNAKGLTLLSPVVAFEAKVNGAAVTVTSEPLTYVLPTDLSKVKDERKVTAAYVNSLSGKWEYAGGLEEDGVYVFNTQSFASVAIVEGNKTFSDIMKHWAKDEVEVLASLLIVNGRTDTTFVPKGQLTRAEFAVLLARTLQLPTREAAGSFTDLPASHWSVQGVEAAARAGIVNGMPNGSFQPNAPITREQMATMIMRAVEYLDPELVEEIDVSDYEGHFSDEAKIAPYAKESIYQAVEIGLLQGLPNGSFAPKNNTTRAESAVVVYRFLQN